MARAPGEVLPCFLVVLYFLVVLVASQELNCPSDKFTNTGDKSTATATWSVPRGNGLSDVSCNVTSGAAFPIGTSTVQCSATNSTGDIVTCTFRVVVTDTGVPEITCPSPVRRTMTDFQPMGSLSSVVVSWEPPPTRDNAGPPQTSYTHESGTDFDLGSTTVRYTTRDRAGNVNTMCSFDVSVVVQPPRGHVFAKNPTEDRFTVVWPQSVDGAVTDYDLLHWKKGEARPDSSRRILVMLDDDAMKYTYVEHTVDNLEPAELYNVEVSSESDGVIALIQQWTQPMPPTALQATVIYPSSVELSWTSSPGNVEQYRVTGLGDALFVTKETVSVRLDGLDPSLSYTGRVTAVVGSGTKQIFSNSASKTFTTGPVNASQLFAYDYTESRIKVVWRYSDATTSANEPYMLLIDPPDADKNFLTVFNNQPPNSRDSAEFTGLEPNTEYRIRLISNLGLSLGTSQKTRPGRVRNLRATAVANESVTLEWDPPAEGTVSSYQVTVSPAGSANEPAMESDTSRVFVDLRYGTGYTFGVVSVHDGMKSISQLLSVTAGVTKTATDPLNQEAIVVGSVLGVLVLVLAVILGAVCFKYRALKSQDDEPALARKGRVNEAVALDHQYKVSDDQGGDADVYEMPTTRTPDPGDEYEVTDIGKQQGARKGPPKLKIKPNFGKR